jgi:hypothetical protein
MTDQHLGTKRDVGQNVVALRRAKPSKRAEIPASDGELTSQVTDALNAVARQQSRTPLDDLDFYEDDLKSIESEKFFGRRFGFVLGRRGREAVIRLMDEYDCTSAEIRALHLVRSLHWDGQMLRFKNVGWLKMLGVLQIAVLTFFTVLFFVVIMINQEAAWHIRLSLVMIAVTLMICLQWVHRTFIMPFRALKRRVSTIAED